MPQAAFAEETAPDVPAGSLTEEQTDKPADIDTEEQTESPADEQAGKEEQEQTTDSDAPSDESGDPGETPSGDLELIDISNASVSGIKDVFYRGTAVTFPVVVVLEGKTLSEGADYTVVYENNDAVGTGTVTITGTGDYEGTIEKSFRLRYYGWRSINGQWYYYNQNGTMEKNTWAQDTVGWCWMDANGRVTRSKWINYSGKWYYLKPNGYMAADEWAKDSKGWCWLGSEGAMLRSKWLLDKNEWYYLKDDGHMAANQWLKDSHGWCYAGSNGKLLKNAWREDSKQWCWINGNRYYDKTAHWAKDSKGWYFKDSLTSSFKNMWMRDSKGWCWLNSYGYYDAAVRYYQNPAGMIQITTTISKHGLSYYVSPCRVNNGSTRSEHIEAMISRAYDYIGDPFVVCQSREPGKGVDCSGLVMQAGYAAGVDFWPSNPKRHLTPAYEYESREIWKLSTLETVSWANRQRGDLIFYANDYGTVIHIAIYLGNNKIIHAYPGTVRVSSVYGWGNIKGVKRVFH